MRDRDREGKNHIGQVDKLRAQKARLEPVSRSTGENKKAQDGLKELSQAIMGNAYIGITMIDHNYKILMVNNVVSKYFHKPVSKLIGRECFREFEKCESICPHCPGTKAMAAGKPAETETEGIRDDGSHFPVRIQTFPTFGPDGAVTGFVGIIENITERKRAEDTLRESEKQASAAIEAARALTFNYDIATGKVNWGGAIEEITGYTPEEFAQIDVDGWAKRLHPDDKDRVLSVLQEAIQDKDRATAEYRFKTKKGYVTLSSISLTERENGKAVRLVGILQDITERRWAELLIRKERDKAQKYLDVSAVMLVAIDSELRVGLINKKGCEILGYSEEEIIGKNWFDNFLPKRIKDQIKEIFNKVVRGESDGPEYYENPILTKDGDERLIAWHNTILKDDRGEVIATLSSGEDITERKWAEEELRRIQKDQEAILTTMSEHVVYRDMEMRILWANRAAGESVGLAPEQLVGRYCYEIWHQRRKPCLVCPVKEVIKSGKREEMEVTTPDGRIWFICAYPIKNANGEIIGIANTTLEVTERKRIEEVLRKSEKKYKDLFENAREAIITMDLKGNITNANKLVEEYGYKREELIGKSHFEFIVEKHRAEALKGFDRLVHGDIVEGEIELITPKGNIIVEYRDNPILWEGQIIGVQAILTDITERKKVEEELQRQKEELQVILDSVPASILYKDKENHFIRVNKICADLLGRPIEKIEGKSCFELFPPDQAEAYWRDDKEVIASGHPKRKIIEPVETPEGTRLVQTDKIPYRNGKGNVIGVIGFAIDITERKRAEKALRESEEKFKGIFEHANDGVIYLDGSGKILDVNRKAIQIFGVSKKQVLNKHFITQLGIFPADQIPTLMSSFERILDGKEVILTVSIKNKEGKEIILECSASLATTNGQTSNIMVIARDITERQKAAEQIAKLAKFPAEDPNPVLRISAFGTVIYGNKASLPLLKTWRCRVGQSLPERWHRLVLDALSSGQSEQTEFQCDGRTFSLIFAPVLNANYVNIYGLDITELKEVEKQLLQNQAQLRTLASKLSLTEERERRRIASELHDQIGQSLAVSKIKLEALRKSCSYKDKEAEKNFDEICETLGQAIVDMRSLIFDLSSPILHELGFGKAVMECLIEQIEKKHAIQTEFEDDDLPKPLDDDVQSILFRNVRELLINVVKYARANKVKVSIRRIDTQIQIIVEDDGIGFNVQEMTKTATGMGGFGLFSIQEGLDHLGGHIALESEPGHGCKVTMTAPLKL